MSSSIFILLQNVTYAETIGLVYPIIIAIVPYFDQRALGPLGDNPVNTKHLYNICTMLDKRLQHCTNVIQMFCVCWEVHQM